MNKNFKKNMLWNIIGSLSYVFASMFFAIIVTRINGLEEAGAFGIAFSLSNLLLCVANYATRTFHVTETKLKDKMIKKDYKNFKKIIRSIIFKVIVFMFILTSISYFYGENILGSIYSVDLSGYQTMIVMVIIGASLCGITYILSAALTTIRSTLSQSVIYILVSILTFILSSNIINSSGMYGAILAYLITMIVLISLYLITYINKINK